MVVSVVVVAVMVVAVAVVNPNVVVTAPVVFPWCLVYNLVSGYSKSCSTGGGDNGWSKAGSSSSAEHDAAEGNNAACSSIAICCFLSAFRFPGSALN